MAERTHVTQSPDGAAPSRRNFLALLGAGTLTAAAGAPLAACGKRAGSAGAATNANAIAAVVPTYKALELLKPDIPGEGSIPNGYLRYPSSLVDAISVKPGTTSQPIKTILPHWGPTPPGLGRNAFVDAVNEKLGVTVDPSVQDGNSYADKLSAMLGARDVPDILAAPKWEIGKIPRFSDAVRALFTDLTDYLKGDAALAYPMLASLPTAAWQYSVWGGRLAAVPYPSDGPFAYALFYRKDLTDKAGVDIPKSIDQLYEFGKKLTNPSKGVWAFGNIFDMVQMFFRCPGVRTGWRRKPSGGLEHKYELPEYRQALEFTARVYREGLVHPDVIGSRGADSMLLFNAGRIMAVQDGLGAWRATQSEQSKVTPTYDMQPMPMFSATSGDPVAWGDEEPTFYTFVKKGLPKARVEELLRVLNWCAAPFGSKEYELNRYGVEGKHFLRAKDGSPYPTDLGHEELADQYRVIGGRIAAEVRTSDTPNYVRDSIAYQTATMKYFEPDLFRGIKLEFPANYSKLIVNTEDKITDVLRGRRPLAELDTIVKEWRSAGGDEGRAFFEKALADNGR
jgi:putative aldouronate transport system substrate-binding protein